MASNLKSLSDQQLIDLFKTGQTEVFGELYERYYKVVYQRCRHLCHDEDVAFDLSQEVMLKVFEHLHNFRGESNFKTWIYTIASRHCFSFLHRTKVNFPVTEHLMDTVADESDEDQNTIMLALINRLPFDERNLLLKKYEAGVSVEELQREFNISGSAVKMRLKRSREKLNALYSLALSFGVDYALNMIEIM